MEIIDNTINVFSGEQFTQRIGGIDYNLKQIVICLFNLRNQIKHSWVKIADEDYPDADLIQKSGIEDYPLQIFLSEKVTQNLESGEYFLEFKGEVNGVFTPIKKVRMKFFNLKKSISK